MSDSNRIGWYSSEQDKLRGSLVYSLADDPNARVIVTLVLPLGVRPRWPDAHCVGPVGDYIAQYKLPNFPLSPLPIPVVARPRYITEEKYGGAPTS